MKNKLQVYENIKASKDLKKAIKKCRDAYYQRTKGSIPNRSASQTISDLFEDFLIQLVKTEKNEFTMSNKVLSELTGIETKKLADRMKRYFKESGLGDFASTGSNRHNIFKTIDKDGNEQSCVIKKESHFTFYISVEMLNAMEEYNIATDVLDYDKLRKDAENSAKLLEQIRNTKTTSVFIQQYISESITIETLINVERDLLNKQGTYEKKSELIVEDKQGKVNKTVIEDTANEFTPKVKKELPFGRTRVTVPEERAEELYKMYSDGELAKEELTREEKLAIAKLYPGCFDPHFSRSITRSKNK